MRTLRERHAHMVQTPRKGDEGKCDATILIAAGDRLFLALTGLHLRVGDEAPECSLDGCDAREALARWKETTDA